MTDAEVFQAAFATVRNPEAWQKNVYAVNKWGDSVSPKSPDAIRFCSVGAIANALHIDVPFLSPTNAIESVLDEAAAEESGHQEKSIAGFNDTHTHAEVVALWEKVGRDNGWLP